MAIKRISSSRCSRVRSTLGSRNSAKYFRGLSIPLSHPTQPNSHIAIKMRLPCSLEGGVTTAIVFGNGGDDAQPQHKSRDCEHSAQNPRRGIANRQAFQIYALHVKPPFRFAGNLCPG